MAITRKYLADQCDARDKFYGFCEANQCEKCIVANLINDALILKILKRKNWAKSRKVLSSACLNIVLGKAFVY